MRVCLRGLMAALALWCQPGWAQQQVDLAGVLGTRALLIVDGAAPKAVAPGDTHQGVKVISTTSDSAVIEVGGKRQTLRLGSSAASVGVPAVANSQRRIVLTADGAGHFLTAGTINGRTVQFMVDTGATTVAIGQGEAQRVGINFLEGQPVRMNTANGQVQGWRVRVASIRINNLEVYDVDTVVLPQAMPFVLLGNSYLTRFQMQRNNEQLTLERRY